MTDEDNEVARKYHLLQKDSARLLNYDIDHLTPAQEIRLDRVCALRLEIDRLTMLQLSGQQFDIIKLVQASEALERLISPTGIDLVASPNFSGAREAFTALIEAQCSRLDAREAHVNEQLRAEITELKAQIERLCAAPPSASPPPSDSDQSPSPPDQTSQLSTPPPQPPQPPRHYLRDDASPLAVFDGGRNLPPPGSARSPRAW
jgi:hypothetical protein